MLEEIKMKIDELKKEIKEQGEQNIKLFNSIPVATHEDPLNKKADPILTEWRKGSVRIKSLIKELAELERVERVANNTNKTKENRTFVNSFGEATKRNITTSAYERAENRNKKAMLSFMGNR